MYRIIALLQILQRKEISKKNEKLHIWLSSSQIYSTVINRLRIYTQIWLFKNKIKGIELK